MGAAVRNSIRCAAPNEGLKPYWDEREFYVGQVADYMGINLSLRLSDKERKHSYKQKRIRLTYVFQAKKSLPGIDRTGWMEP